MYSNYIFFFIIKFKLHFRSVLANYIETILVKTLDTNNCKMWSLRLDNIQFVVIKL